MLRSIVGAEVAPWGPEKYKLLPNKAKKFEGLFQFLVENMTPEAEQEFARLYDAACLSGEEFERFVAVMAMATEKD